MTGQNTIWEKQIDWEKSKLGMKVYACMERGDLQGAQAAFAELKPKVDELNGKICSAKRAFTEKYEPEKLGYVIAQGSVQSAAVPPPPYQPAAPPPAPAGKPVLQVNAPTGSLGIGFEGNKVCDLS